MLKPLQTPDLIQPYAPACPAGAEVLRKIAFDLNLRPLSENVYDILVQFSGEPLVGYALLLAAERHAGITYQHAAGAFPYLYHLVDVAWCLANVLSVTDPFIIVCGLWHDMLEDLLITESEVRAYLSQVRPLAGKPYSPNLDDEILACLKALIRPGTGKEAAMVYYGGLAAASPAARTIKAADLICNTAGLKSLHHQWYGIAPIPRSPRMHVIAKYVTETDRYLFHQPAFTTLETYPKIHNTLLGILQDLLQYIYREYPHQLGMLDSAALQNYQTPFRPAANRILKLSVIYPQLFNDNQEKNP